MSNAQQGIEGFTVLGHRGAKAHAPENTIISFEKGIELGATMLELDIHLSKDGEMVVIHDGTVDRTTDGTGYVHEKTLAELQALDASSWFDESLPVQRIPTLQEVIEATKGRIYLNIEIKLGGDKESGRVAYTEIPAKLRDCLIENDMVDQVVVSSFHQPYITELKKILPEIRVALLHKKPVENLIEKALDEGWEAVHTHTSLIDEDFVKAAHDEDIRVRAWNPNDAETMQKMIELGVDGIGTDYPEVLLELAKEANRV